MISRRVQIRAILVASLLTLASCASTTITHTGFLEDYEALERTEEVQVAGVPAGVELFVADGSAARGYDAILIEEVVYRQADGVAYEPSAKEVDKILADYRKILRKGLAERFEVVDEPRPGALRLRTAVTEVNPVNVWANVIGVIVLVPFDMGGVSGEMELVDAETDERQLAFTACRDGTVFLLLECFSRFGHMRHGMQKWTRMVRETLTADA